MMVDNVDFDWKGDSQVYAELNHLFYYLLKCAAFHTFSVKFHKKRGGGNQLWAFTINKPK